jgi:hypothetical protein
LFNIFIEDVIYFIGGFAVNGLQKGIDQVVKYGGKGTE